MVLQKITMIKTVQKRQKKLAFLAFFLSMPSENSQFLSILFFHL